MPIDSLRGLDLWLIARGMRYRVWPDSPFEVFTQDGHLLGELTGATILRIVEHHLTAVALVAGVSRELTGRRARAQAAIEVTVSGELPPGPLSKERKELRKMARRSRKAKRTTGMLLILLALA